MAYHYSALHNTILNDGKDDDKEILEDGKSLRVSMLAMDSMQRAIAGTVATVDDDNVTLVFRQEMQDWDKAQLSARWKGGLAEGDTFRLNDKLMVVTGRNPENGKIQVRDASTSAQDAEARQQAYMQYDHDIQSRYLNTYDAKAGEACQTAGREKGTWREKNGRLVCTVGGDKSSKENELAGPLSDAARTQIKDQMYSDYDTNIQNAWRK